MTIDKVGIMTTLLVFVYNVPKLFRKQIEKLKEISVVENFQYC